MPTTILKSRNGRLDAADQAKLDALTQRLAAGRVPLHLHLHGGLVDEAAGQAIAGRLAGPNGLRAPAEWEQVYVIWRTGAFESLLTNWRDLFDNDRLYKALLRKLLAYAAGKVSLPGAEGRSAFNALSLTPTEINRRLAARPAADPFADVDFAPETLAARGGEAEVAAVDDGTVAVEFSALLEGDFEFNSAVEDLAAALSRDPDDGSRSLATSGDMDVGDTALQHLNPAVRAELDGEAAPARGARAAVSAFKILQMLIKHGTKIAIRVIQRFRTRRDHGFYATICEEIVRELYADLIGAAVWGMMKRDAGDHFGQGGLGASLVEAAKAAPSVKITAHSAGAIWAAEMISVLGGDGPTLDVALLAPAVRMDLFAAALAKGGGRVRSLRMYTMRDELERKDPVLGSALAFVYPSSLLYLVSGLFEEDGSKGFPDAPLVGLNRFWGDDLAWLDDDRQIAAAKAVRAAFAPATNGVVLSTTTSGAVGLSSQATSHGGFDQDKDTLASAVHFLQS